MMAGNPSRWSMHPPSHLQPSANFLLSSPSLFPSYVLGSSSPSPSPSSSSLPLNSFPDQNQELPQSWSQLLLGGLSGEEENRLEASQFHSKKQENWDDKTLNPYHSRFPPLDDVKQQVPETSNLYGHGDEEIQPLGPTWPTQSVLVPVSAPRSCATTSNTNILDFSHSKADGSQHLDQTFECNSSATGGVCKKPRVQPSSGQPPLKVRKEKLGDRITALHQLVSPFGKTDTASVLLEAIGYIRFLQGQIEALSSPYMTATASSNTKNHQSVRGEKNCVFPEDPGQDKPKDLRSRGLCLVPVSCTQHVGSDDNGSDYGAPATGGGF